MRRFLTLVCLLCLTIPAGISISGCTRNPGADYCNGLGYGPKITDVASITLQPATTGISLAFGQTRNPPAPNAITCKGDQASVANFTWGTTNNQLADVSPSGNICAGTWNRNSGGGIGDYTICRAPNPLPMSKEGLPYSTAFLTASASSVTSNPVEIYVHAQVTSLSLVGPQECLSQGTLWDTPLDVQACYSGIVSGKPSNVLMCKPSTITNPSQFACPLPPGVSSVPNCTTAVGALSFTVGTANVASINSETNQITAEQPGTSLITASVAGSGSSAGYFSTCPPEKITLTLANGTTKGIITKGIQQNLVTTVTDTKGSPIVGTILDYQSTDPIDLSVTASGGVIANFPGEASIYAICQPTTCNPAPINELGLFGTGLPISSNPVTVTTPGTASAYVWFAAPGLSQYIIPVELLSGTIGSTIRLPYVPNSMAMDRNGLNLYFGSERGLMVVNPATNTLTKQDTTVPGVVLAIAPNNSAILINDQVRRVFYLSGSTGPAFGGVGTAAAWTPDSKTLYITGSDPATNKPTLFVYNASTGWTTHDLSTTTGGSKSIAITIPSVGAYLNGSPGFPTVAHTWCPTGAVGDYQSMSFYPQGDAVCSPQGSGVCDSSNNPVQTDVLAATTDGEHILGGVLNGSNIRLWDIGVTIPADNCLPPATDNNPLANGDPLHLLSLTHNVNSVDITANALAINQVVVSPASNLAFITYNPSSATSFNAKLPYYQPVAGNATPGAVGYVTLTGASAITAPLTGAFTPDDKLFFVSTAGDNMIHYIDVPTLKDIQQISPNLPACTPVSAGGNDIGCNVDTNTTTPGSPVPATAIAVKPRSTT